MGRDRASCACQCTRFDVCTSLVPKQITVVIGLGTSLNVRMHARLENGVLCSGQQLGSAVNSFFDHSKSTKSLSGWEDARCDEHQFRAKIKVST